MFFFRRPFDLEGCFLKVKPRRLGVPAVCENQYLSHGSMCTANFVPHTLIGRTDFYPTL